MAEACAYWKKKSKLIWIPYVFNYLQDAELRAKIYSKDFWACGEDVWLDSNLVFISLCISHPCMSIHDLHNLDYDRLRWLPRFFLLF